MSGTDPIVCTADGELTTAGSVLSGSYAATAAVDGVFEAITEQDAAIGLPPKRADLLDHTWQFNVAAGNGFQLIARAYRTGAGGDGDDFAFSYSKDGGQSWNGMFTVASDVSSSYQNVIPGNATGTLLVRVVDTDRTGGKKNHATLFVDYLAVAVSSVASPPPRPIRA